MLLANVGSLYIRSSEDAKMTNTLAWKTILDSSNYSSILDSRYYTESEVNNLLSKKLNTSDFNWTNLPDKLVSGNEFNIVNAGFKEGMWFNYLPINDRSKTATITGYHFGNGATGYTSIKASGFIKNGSNSNYVLLGDGGHKAISDFATAAQGVGTIISISKSLTPTTSWIDTGIKTDSATFPGGKGSYIVQVSVPSSSGTDGWGDLYTGYFSLFTGTDSSTEDEILLHGASHSLVKRIYLKTKATAKADGTMHFYIASEKAFSAARTINFKFRKLI